MNNYHALYAVFGALQANSIYKLSHAWKGVKKDKKCVKRMDSLKILFNTDYNQRNLRNEIRRTTGPVVPYIGIYLKDLTFIEDGNKGKIQDPRENKSKMVNFNKCVRIAERVREIYQKAQRPPYADMEPDYVIQKALLQELREAEKISSDDIWNLSTMAKEADAREAASFFPKRGA